MPIGYSISESDRAAFWGHSRSRSTVFFQRFFGSDAHSLGRAAPAWDSNPLDSGQTIEIAEVATTYDRWSAGRTYAAAEIELRNSLR
jgi:hypothetical protein